MNGEVNWVIIMKDLKKYRILNIIKNTFSTILILLFNMLLIFVAINKQVLYFLKFNLFSINYSFRHQISIALEKAQILRILIFDQFFKIISTNIYLSFDRKMRVK
jgi:hypothetical protein